MGAPASIGVVYGLMESLVFLQVIKAVHNEGANIKLALPTVKTVIAIQISVFISEHGIAPLVC